MKTSPALSREASSLKSGISLRTQERWIQRYLRGGVEALITDAPNLKKSKIITKDIHQGLSKRVNCSDNPLLGYWVTGLLGC